MFEGKEMKEISTDSLPTDDFYERLIRCNNCEIENEFKIPKGITIKLFKHSTKCLNCECKLDTKRGLLDLFNEILSKKR